MRRSECVTMTRRSGFPGVFDGLRFDMRVTLLQLPDLPFGIWTRDARLRVPWLDRLRRVAPCPDLTAEDIAIAAKRYRERQTLTQLGHKFRVLPKTMWRALVTTGVVIRLRGRREGSK